jgi:rod shape-determining protein MreD
VTVGDVAKIVGAVFFAAIVQTAVVASFDVGSGSPDLLLVMVIAVALLRGSIAGAAAGFFGGLLVDTASLDTLGLTSLLLTLAGYGVGRYGETTGRGRPHASVVATAAVTLLYLVGAFLLHVLLAEEVSGRVLGEAIPVAMLFNVLLMLPVFALMRRLLPPPQRTGAREVSLLV